MKKKVNKRSKLRKELKEFKKKKKDKVKNTNHQKSQIFIFMNKNLLFCFFWNILIKNYFIYVRNSMRNSFKKLAMIAGVS